MHYPLSLKASRRKSAIHGNQSIVADSAQAGLVAYLLSLEGPRTPFEMKTRVQSLALTDVLANIRKGPRS